MRTRTLLKTPFSWHFTRETTEDKRSLLCMSCNLTSALPDRQLLKLRVKQPSLRGRGLRHSSWSYIVLLPGSSQWCKKTWDPPFPFSPSRVPWPVFSYCDLDNLMAHLPKTFQGHTEDSRVIRSLLRFFMIKVI